MVRGESDGNGRVGPLDLLAIRQCLGSGDSACCVADLDLDGEVGASDLHLLISLLVHRDPVGPGLEQR